MAFGSLWQALMTENRNPTAEKVLSLIPTEMTRFEFVDQNGEPLIMFPEQVEGTGLCNLSIYLVKTTALRYVLNQLNRDNAQKEEYLSDMISILAQAREGAGLRFRVQALRVGTVT